MKVSLVGVSKPLDMGELWELLRVGKCDCMRYSEQIVCERNGAVVYLSVLEDPVSWPDDYGELVDGLGCEPRTVVMLRVSHAEGSLELSKDVVERLSELAKVYELTD